MTDITIDEITESTLEGSGYFDKFMVGINAHLKVQYDKHRIKSSEYASVYLGAMQNALTEAVKLAIGRQLASAQADLAIENISKIAFDKDLIAAEIRLKDAATANTITENGLILERITNLEKDTLIKIQDELVKKKEVVLMQSRIEKSAVEITKLIADIARVNQDTANALSQNAVIVAEAARVIASTLKIEEDTKLVTLNLEKTVKQIDLLVQDILLKSKEVVLTVAKISITAEQELKVIAETALTAKRVELTSKEIEKLTQDILAVIANTKLTKARVSNTDCETLKCATETDLVEQRVVTETANTDGSVVKFDSIFRHNIDLTKEKIKSESANTDGSVISVGSIFSHQVAKMVVDSESVKAKYNPSGIVTGGSIIDCEAQLTCARVESERANFTPIGEDTGEISPTSLLGSKAKLTIAQAESEEATLDPVNVKADSMYQAKTDKMIADANNSLAQYDPVEAGVLDDSKLGYETSLLLARSETEAANLIPIGIGSNELNPNSVMGSKGSLTINQSKTEKANINGEDVTEDSLLRQRIDKMKSDANTALANYDPLSAGVTEGSKIDCEAKLTCAKVKSESANYTEIGNDPDQIDPTSYLGARTDLLIQQARTETANTDGTNVKDNSLISARIAKSNADVKAVVATYDPEEAEVKGGSLVDCNAKLACAKAESERANYTSIGTDKDLVHPTSLLGARANLLIKQANTEEANIDPINVKPESVYQAKIDKMVADANNSLAQYDPITAGVQDGSKLDCDTQLSCAKAESERANFTPVGLGEEEINPSSLIGARADLLINQSATEKANVDSSDVKVDSVIGNKIEKMEADTKSVIAKFDPIRAGVIDDSIFDGDAQLTLAKARSEEANYTEIGNDPGQIDPTSYLGARTNLLINQAETEKANTDGSNLGEDSFLQAKIDKAKADVRISVARFDPEEAGVKSGSVIDCEAKLSCAKSSTELAQLIALGEDEGQLEPTSPLGARANLLVKQALTEETNYDPANIEAGSLIQAKIDKAETDARIALAQIDPVGAEVRKDSKVDCETKLTCAKVKTESANYTPIGEGEGFIHPLSFLGARADLITKQTNTEKANYDAGHVEEDSLLSNRIDKMKADANEALSKYDPLLAGVKDGSLLDCNAKLACARTDAEIANFTEIGNDPDQIDPTSLVGARANLLVHQVKTELANTDPTGLREGSFVKAKIDKMVSDANISLAQLDPELAGVQEGSNLACEAELTCAKASTEKAQLLSVGEGKGFVSATSTIGARATLLGFQSKSEKANTDGSGLTADSLMRSKIDKMRADAEVAEAPLLSVGLGTGQLNSNSKLGLETILTKAQTKTEQANTDDASIDPKSFVGARVQFLLAQKDKMDEDALLTIEQANLAKAKYDGSTAQEGSLIDCQASLACAKAGEILAKYTVALDSEGNPVPVDETTVLGAEYRLINAKYLTEEANTMTKEDGLVGQQLEIAKAQVITELAKTVGTEGTGIMHWDEKIAEIKAKFEGAKYNNENVTDGSWFAAQRDLAVENVLALKEKVLADKQSVLLVEAQVATEKAKAASSPAAGSLNASQIALYAAQAEHYASDTRFKKAKLYTDMYSVSMTQDHEAAKVMVKVDAVAKVNLI